MSELSDLRTLKAQLLEQEIRQAKAEADIAEFDRDKRYDEERDRAVKPGRIRHLYLDGIVNRMNVTAWLDALSHWELRDPGEPIKITINSPGGSVLDGLALYDAILRLRRKGHHVVTRGTGLIASMATILMQAGDERILDANSWFMIHEVSAGAQGTSSDMEDQLAFVKRLNDRLHGILAERSTLTKRQILSRTKKKDDWLSAEEAVSLGFADKVE